MLTAQRLARPRLPKVHPPPQEEQEPRWVPAQRRRRILLRIGLVLLATSVLWVHGCHGEEDNELGILFGPRTQLPSRARSAAE
jgi:hypothetical protein